jgi:uncharacterized RDD family membrane protein YckC
MSPNNSFTWGAESLARGGGSGRRGRSARSSARRMSLLGARAAAIVVDGLVLLVPLLAVAYALSIAFPHRGFFFTTASNGSLAGTSQISAGFHIGASGALVISALSLGYFFLFEALRGQTIGKRAMGLRVQSAGGGAAGLNAISARTVLRLIDGLVLYLVGALVALVSGSRRRRLGDWLGGTVVVWDDGTLDDPPSLPLWRALAYPSIWVIAVLVVVFAFGVGHAVGADEQAVSLAESYVKARQAGDGARACSMLSPEQRRELVAIQTRDYRDPDAARCGALILGSDPESHLLTPGLAAFASGPLTARYSSAGVALVRSQSSPSLSLVVIFEGGRAELDVRGAEKLEFLKGCRLSGGGSARCHCAWQTLRAEGLLDQMAGVARTTALGVVVRRCHDA